MQAENTLQKAADTRALVWLETSTTKATCCPSPGAVQHHIIQAQESVDAATRNIRDSIQACEAKQQDLEQELVLNGYLAARIEAAQGTISASSSNLQERANMKQRAADKEVALARTARAAALSAAHTVRPFHSVRRPTARVLTAVIATSLTPHA